MNPYVYVIDPQNISAYSPANHSGTSNRRVIGRETVGAQRVEALIGEIVAGQGAHPHAHPTLEQATLVLEGECVGQIEGKEVTLKAGELLFNPMGKFHSVVTKTPVRLLVVYAPPYAENPNAAQVYDERMKAEGKIIGEDSHVLRPRDDKTFTPREHDAGTVCRPIVNQELVGSRFIEFFLQETAPGSGATAHVMPGTERFVVIEQGELAGKIAGEPFSATAGDWVFVPEGSAFEYAASGAEPMQAIVVQAHA